MTLYWTGMRLGELLALNPKDVDLEKRTIAITKSYQRLGKKDVITPPKTPKSKRVITIPEFLAADIKDYMDSLYDLQENDGRCVLIPSALPHLRKVTGKYNTLTGSTLAHLLINPFAPEYQLNLSMFREAIAKRNCQFRCSALFRMLESQLRSIVEKHEPYWQEYASCKLRELILSFFQENFPELPVNEGVAHVAKNQEVIGRLLYMIAVWSNFSMDARSFAEAVGFSERHLSRKIHHAETSGIRQGTSGRKPAAGERRRRHSRFSRHQPLLPGVPSFLRNYTETVCSATAARRP